MEFSSIPYLIYYGTVRSAREAYGKLVLKILTPQKLKINLEKVEKYRIVISKKNWLPIRIERHGLDGKPMEITQIENYSINTHLGDALFHSR